MKTEILRLESVVEHGVGGIGAGAISLIYSYLLQQYGLDFYSLVFINQIGEDLDEVVINQGKNVYINIRYPAVIDYELKTVNERDFIRLNIVHSALHRLSELDSRIQKEKLDAIRQHIIDRNFLFDIEYKRYINKHLRNIYASLFIHPHEDRFDFYVQIKVGESVKEKVFIYSGKTNDFYFDALFRHGYWKENLFVLSGSKKEVEFHMNIDTLQLKYVNLTNYQKPPFFEMMRSDISQKDNEKAYDSWINSLPPEYIPLLGNTSN